MIAILRDAITASIPGMICARYDFSDDIFPSVHRYIRHLTDDGFDIII